MNEGTSEMAPLAWIFKSAGESGDFQRDWGDWEPATLETHRLRLEQARKDWHSLGYWVDFAVASGIEEAVRANSALAGGVGR